MRVYLSLQRVRQQRKISFEVESHCEAEALAWSKQMSTWHSVYVGGYEKEAASKNSLSVSLLMVSPHFNDSVASHNAIYAELEASQSLDY